MFEYTGCDAVMVARGAQGNPWIFRRIREYLATGNIPSKPDFYEVKATIARHAEMLMSLKGEWTAVRELRKHVAWYTEGFPYSAKLRNEINLCETMEELTDKLEEYGQRLEEYGYNGG